MVHTRPNYWKRSGLDQGPHWKCGKVVFAALWVRVPPLPLLSISGCSSAWPEYSVRIRGVAGSNPATLTPKGKGRLLKKRPLTSLSGSY